MIGMSFNQKYIYIIISLFITVVPVIGQISEGGVPPSFSFRNNNLRSLSQEDILEIPVDFDRNRLIWEDSIAETNRGAIRVARTLPANISIDRNGEWIDFSDSVKIWRQTVRVPNAHSVIISYKKFYIPEGAKLFIYNKDKSQILGAYTHKTNTNGGHFSTEMVNGDTFTLEYVASNISTEKPELEIEDVGYVYDRHSLLRLLSDNVLTYNLKANECIPNINCLPAGNIFRDQKRGVVLLVLKVNNSWWGCTGSLINNTNQDGTPYVLTASHCFTGDYADQSKPRHDELIAYFNYEESGCNFTDKQPNLTQTIVGGNVLTFIPLMGGSDAALFKLNSEVPSSYKAYFNGWSRSINAPVSGGLVHHPRFDIKRFAKYGSETSNPAVNIITVPQYGGASSAFFKVVYNGEGVSQPGSSGGPLFNEDGLIVGTLTSGASQCAEPLSPDYYGRFYYHWDKYDATDPYRSLKTYLDPKNTSVEKLKGHDPNGLPAGKEEIIEDTVNYILFPNPATDEVNINSKSIIKSISVFDLKGRLTYSIKNTNASTHTINVSNFIPGVYSIVLETMDGAKKTDKFIKK